MVTQGGIYLVNETENGAKVRTVYSFKLAN